MSSAIKIKDIGSIKMCRRILKEQTTTNPQDVPFYKISTFGGVAENYIPWDVYNEYKQKYAFPNNGAILISAAGTIGKTVVYHGEDAYFQDSNIVWVDNDEQRVSNRYLYYALKLSNWKTTDGSTIKRLYNDNILDLDIPYNGKDEQEKIASVLSTIDDKISTNDKIIETSEKLMHEIYDYWFVQFDFPDENGRPYKSSGGEMVYDETIKREIPKGWGVTTLGELYDIYQPGILSAKQCDPDGEYEVHGSNGVIGRYHEYNHEDSEIVISCRGDCGNIHRVMPKTWITGNAMVIKPKIETNQSREYLKNMLGTLGIKNISTGSVQGQITRTNLAPIKIVTPSESVLGRYAKIANPSSELIITTNLENRKLEELRDWLLPMLMNGQVTIKEK